MIQTKTLNKRIPTKSQGVFYKQVVDEKGKEVDKVYLIRYLDEDGREKLKTVGKHSQGIRIQICVEMRHKTMTAVALGTDAPHLTKQKSQLTLNDIAEEYFEASKAKDKTRLRSRYDIHHRNGLGKKRIDNIAVEDIEKKQKELSKTFAPATVNLTIGIISTIYNHHIKKGSRVSNPAKAVSGIKLDNKRERFLSKDEVQELLDYVRDDIDEYLFVLLSLSTGGRLNTILNITKRDLRLEQNSVQLKDFKNDGTYYGFYDDELKYLLMQHAKNLKASDKIILTDYVGNRSDRMRYRIGKMAMNKLFNDDLKSGDRKHRAVTHTLRHTFASHLAMNGASIITIKNLMHHANIEMTLRYSHLMPDSGKDEVFNLYK